MWLMAACRSPETGDGKSWAFYLVNDTDEALESALLEEVGYEWNGSSNAMLPLKEAGPLEPRTFREVWSDDDDAAELRMWFRVRVRSGGVERLLLFEFPKLYRVSAAEPIPLVGRQGVVRRPEEAGP